MLVEKESPLELLALQVRELEARRDAVEEELDQTPSWRFRRRAQLEGQLQYSLSQERELMTLVGMAAKNLKRPSS